MYESLLNFRPVGGILFADNEITKNSVGNANTLKLNVFRSGRPDNITEEDIDMLKKNLDIRTVIDLRTFENDYEKEDGKKLLDKQGISVQSVDEKAMEKQRSSKILWKQENDELVSSEKLIKHCMIGVFGTVFFKGMMKGTHITFYQKFWLYVLLFFHLVFGTNHFTRYLQHVLAECGLLTMYKMIVDYSSIAIRSALQLMSQPENLPCIITCHVGKDRTGIISALVLAVCGYDHYTIGDDYSLSEIAIPNDHPEVAYLQQNLRPASREVMIELLEYIDDTYGSVSFYLESIGFSLDDQDRLRELVTMS